MIEFFSGGPAADWVVGIVHDLVHKIAGLDYPHGHWWLNIAAALVFIAAPIWTGWHLTRLILWWTLPLWRRQPSYSSASTRSEAIHSFAPAPYSFRSEPHGWPLERYVIRATFRFQLRLLGLSLLTLPAAWFTLEIPKHIINHALADSNGDGHPEMTFLGLHLGRVELLFALCASYLGVLTFSGIIKFAANKVRGGVNERLVRRLRLAVLRRARQERSPEQQATLAAVAVQEVEPIGYFGGSLVVVPLIQGGILVTSVVFLLFQNAALALAALIMLPVQLTILPRLQKRLNGKVRERVYATRELGKLLTASTVLSTGQLLREQLRKAAELERVRVEINDLKGRLKGLYNYTSNLTPFFFFSIGGYLVVNDRLSLGALVAALAAYREISPALREIFEYAQSWSDANARFAELASVLSRVGPKCSR